MSISISSTKDFEFDLVPKNTVTTWTYSSYFENYLSIESELKTDNLAHACGATEIYHQMFSGCQRWLKWLISGNLLLFSELSTDTNLFDCKCFIRLEDKFASIDVQYQGTQYEEVINLIVTIANRDGTINKILISLNDLQLSILSVMIELREGKIINLNDTSYTTSKSTLRIINYSFASLPPNTSITCHAFKSYHNNNNVVIAGLSGGGIIITTFENGINKLSELVVKDVSGLLSLWTGIIGGATVSDTIAITVLSDTSTTSTNTHTTTTAMYVLTLSSTGTLRVIDLDSRQCKGQLTLPVTITGNDMIGLCIEDACLDVLSITKDSFVISLGYDCQLQNRRKWIAEVILVNINRNNTITMQFPVLTVLPPQFLESTHTPSLLDMKFDRPRNTSTTNTIVDSNDNNSIIIYALWKISGITHVVKYVTPNIISSSTSPSTWDDSVPLPATGTANFTSSSTSFMSLEGTIIQSKENEVYFPIKLQPAKLNQAQVAVNITHQEDDNNASYDASYHSTAGLHQYNEENIKAMMLQKLFSDHQYTLELIAKVIMNDIPIQSQSSFALQLQSYFQSLQPSSSSQDNITTGNTWYQNILTLDNICEETLSVCLQWANNLTPTPTTSTTAMELNFDESYTERKSKDDNINSNNEVTSQYTKNLFIAFSKFIELCQKRKQKIQQGQFAKMRTKGSLIINHNSSLPLLVSRHYKTSVAITLPPFSSLIGAEGNISQGNTSNTPHDRCNDNNNVTATSLGHQLLVTIEALYDDSSTGNTTTSTTRNQDLNNWSVIDNAVTSYYQIITSNVNAAVSVTDTSGITNAFRIIANNILNKSTGTTSSTSYRSTASQTANVITLQNILKQISSHYPISNITTSTTTTTTANNNIFQILIEEISLEPPNNQFSKEWNYFYQAKEGRAGGSFSSSTGIQIISQAMESYLLTLQYKSKLVCLCLTQLMIIEEIEDDKRPSVSYKTVIESYYLPKAVFSLLYSTYLLSLRPLRLTPSLPLHQYIDVELQVPLSHSTITNTTIQSLLTTSITATSSTAYSVKNPTVATIQVNEENEETTNVGRYLWETLWTTITTSYLSPALLTADHKQPPASNRDSDLTAILRHCLLALQPSILSPLLKTLNQLEQFHSVSKLSLLLQLPLQKKSKTTPSEAPYGLISSAYTPALYTSPFHAFLTTLQPISQVLVNFILTSTTALTSLQNCLQSLVEYQNTGNANTTNTNYINLLKQKAGKFAEVFYSTAELQVDNTSQYWSTSISMLGSHTPNFHYYTTDRLNQIIQQWLKLSLVTLQEAADAPYNWKDHIIITSEALSRISGMPTFLLLMSTFTEVDVNDASSCHQLITDLLRHCPKILLQLMALYHQKSALEIIGRACHENLLGTQIQKLLLKSAHNNVHTSEKLLQSLVSCQFIRSEHPIATTTVRMSYDEESEDMKGREEVDLEIDPLATIRNEMMKEIQSSWSSVFSCALNNNDFQVALDAIRRLAGMPPLLPISTTTTTTSTSDIFSSASIPIKMEVENATTTTTSSFIPHWRCLLRALLGKVCSTSSGGLQWLCKISSTPLFPIEFQSELPTAMEEEQQVIVDEDLDSSQSSSLNDITVVIAQELEVLANTSDITASLQVDLFDVTNTSSSGHPRLTTSTPSHSFFGTPSRTSLLTPLRPTTTTLWPASTPATTYMEVEATATNLLKASSKLKRIDYYECYTAYLLSRGDFRGAARAQHLLYERIEVLLDENNINENSNKLMSLLETMASALTLAVSCLSVTPSNQAFIVHRPSLVTYKTSSLSGGVAFTSTGNEKPLRVYTLYKLLLSQQQLQLEISLRKYYTSTTTSILPNKSKLSLPELIKLCCMSAVSSVTVSEGISTSVSLSQAIPVVDVDVNQTRHLQFQVDAIMNGIILCNIWKQVEVEVTNDPSSSLMSSTSKDTSSSTTSYPLYEVLLEDCIASLTQLCCDCVVTTTTTSTIRKQGTVKVGIKEEVLANVFGVWLAESRRTPNCLPTNGSTGSTSICWELLKSVLIELDGPHYNWQLHIVAQSAIMKYLPGYRLPEILLLKDNTNKLVINQGSNWRLLELFRTEGRLSEACELGIALLKEIRYEKEDGKDAFVFYQNLDLLLFTCSQFLEKYENVPSRYSNSNSNRSEKVVMVSVAYDNFEYSVEKLRTMFILLQKAIEYHFSMIQIMELN